MTNEILNVIWSENTHNHVLEANFIHENLLSKLNRPIRRLIFKDPKDFPVMNDCLIVSLYDEAFDHVDKLNQANAKNIGILQMGDEYGVLSDSWYDKTDYILRNFFFKEKLNTENFKRCKEIEWIPNGYANGIGYVNKNNLLPFEYRAVNLFFSGFVGAEGQEIPNRLDLVSVIQKHNLQGKFLITSGFAQGLSPQLFSSHLSNTRFALCPAGNNAETIRFYDALENGAIPIVTKSEYLSDKLALNNPPVIILNNWQELPDFLERVNLTPIAELNQLQASIIDWWHSYKNEKFEKIANIIERSFNSY